MTKSLIVKPDGEALAQAALDLLVERLGRTQGDFWLALAGGNTPRALYQKMARTDLPWARLNLIWGDERFVPHDHPDSNYRMVKEALLDSGHLKDDQIHPWPDHG
jgi:6-phosphogluconolactonase